MLYIVYKAGYKYQLVEPYSQDIGIRPGRDIDTTYITLKHNGVLTVRAGYAWDGPSGPTFDTSDFMRGSLVHDVLYQLMRMDLLNREYKKDADRLLQKMCIEDGMPRIRAWWVYMGLQIGGRDATLPKNRKRKIVAPV